MGLKLKKLMVLIYFLPKRPNINEMKTAIALPPKENSIKANMFNVENFATILPGCRWINVHGYCIRYIYSCATEQVCNETINL